MSAKKRSFAALRMTRIWIAASAFGLLAMTIPPVFAAPLTADMSTARIDMDANFSGTRIFLFGAREAAGDIVVVIRGPARDYQLRKKERYAGIWLNSSRIKFFHMPAFYALASSKPLDEVGQPELLRKLAIGEDALFPSYSDRTVLSNYRPYADAFLDYQRARKYYTPAHGTVQFIGDTLFKTTLEFPGNLPPGDYNAEIYLIHKNQVIDQQVLPLTVSKTGLDAWLYAYAHTWPALYGLTAVLLALGAGWSAGRLFEKI
jgi:uncharacterized protein (TIGR02186 family)